MRQLATLILIFTSASSFAQNESAPEYLIPYNNNGKWGWCDTLGKIIIEPQFQKVAFFDYKGRGVVTVVEADVKTNFGYNRYSYPNGLVVPENFILTKELYNSSEKETRRWFTVQSEDKKLGVFESLKKEMVVKPEWDIIMYDSDFEDNIYLKKASEKCYYRFNRLTNKLTKTDIDSVFFRMDPDDGDNEFFVSSRWFFKHLNGTVTKLVDGKEILLTPEHKKRLLSTDEIIDYAVGMEDIGDSFDSYGRTYDSDSRIIDSAMCMIGFIQFPANTSKTSETLKVIRENGKIGIYNKNGILILPIIYDKIAFQDNDRQALLYSGNKVGLKFFFVDYKTVEPKYDSIDFYKKIRVNSRWSFILYEVTLGNKKGLMGENGVEYFHFD